MVAFADDAKLRSSFNWLSMPTCLGQEEEEEDDDDDEEDTSAEDKVCI